MIGPPRFGPLPPGRRLQRHGIAHDYQKWRKHAESQRNRTFNRITLIGRERIAKVDVQDAARALRGRVRTGGRGDVRGIPSYPIICRRVGFQRAPRVFRHADPA